ncbi:MAG: flavin reductase family protein [Actinomycetota bacterium]
MTSVTFDDADFRKVLGHLPTGVVVITALTDRQPIGMSCNSFTSVSLQPPLVGFFPALSSSTWPGIRDSGKFCVNILASHHDELSRAFSRRNEDRFAGVEWSERASGPGLAEAVAWIDCDLHSQAEAGDHVLALGRVTGFEAREDAEPLVFHRGQYGMFAARQEKRVS